MFECLLCYVMQDESYMATKVRTMWSGCMHAFTQTIESKRAKNRAIEQSRWHLLCTLTGNNITNKGGRKLGSRAWVCDRMPIIAFTYTSFIRIMILHEPPLILNKHTHTLSLPTHYNTGLIGAHLHNCDRGYSGWSQAVGMDTRTEDTPTISHCQRLLTMPKLGNLHGHHFKTH